MDNARSRATSKYRKEKVKSFNVKFFPSDAEVFRFFQSRENRNQYIKDLIRKDMEMRSKTYAFSTENKGDVTVSIVGEWRDGGVDIAVDVDGKGYNEWSEADGGVSSEIIEWLLGEGVEFESTRSMWFNAHYIEQVMIDRTRTEDELLDAAASMSDDSLERWRESFE